MLPIILSAWGLPHIATVSSCGSCQVLPENCHWIIWKLPYIWALQQQVVEGRRRVFPIHLPRLTYSQMVRGVKLATLQSQTLLTSLQATAALLVKW